MRTLAFLVAAMAITSATILLVVAGPVAGGVAGLGAVLVSTAAFVKCDQIREEIEGLEMAVENQRYLRDVEATLSAYAYAPEIETPRQIPA